MNSLFSCPSFYENCARIEKAGIYFNFHVHLHKKCAIIEIVLKTTKKEGIPRIEF